MHEPARWERHIPNIILVALLSLVALAPLGKEATHPVIFAAYRVLLLALIVIATWANLREAKGRVVSPRFIALVAALLALMALSVALEPGSRFEGIYAFYKNALFGAAFVAVAAFSARQPGGWKRNVLLGAVAVTLAHLIVVLAVSGGERPLVGAFTNPNYFASFMLPGLAVTVAYAIYGAGWLRAASVAAAVFFCYGILQTVSRGVTLAVVLMMGVAAIRLLTRHVVARKLAFAAAAGAIALALTLGAAFVAARQSTPAVVDKFLDRGQRDPYNYARPLIWLSSIRMIGEHPVLGVGLARYNHAAKRFTPAIEGTLARYRKFPNIAHNEYLQYAVETGLPAAFLLIALAGYVALTAWKRAKRADDESRPIQEAAILSMIGVGAHALVDNNWTVPVLASTLVVVSQADLLPFRAVASMRPTFQWTPPRTALASMALFGIAAQSIFIPAVGLHFNEAGHVAYVAHDFERAESMHALAVGIAPDHPVFLDNLGMVYLDEFTRSHKPEHLDHAATLFEKAIVANPLFDVPLGHLETALIQSLSGRIDADRPIHERIVATDRQLLAVNPYNPFIRRNLAEALYNLGRRDEAQRELSEALVIEPNYAPGYLRLAQWYAEQGETARSGEYTEKAIVIVNRYRNASVDPFEALLLGRPESANP